MRKKFDVSVKQLYLLILIMAASLIGLGLYGINDYKKLNENTRTLYADRVVCMRQLANMRFQYAGEIAPAALSVKDHRLTFDEARQRVRKARLIIDSNWRNYKLTYLTPEENLLAKETGKLKDRVDKDTKAFESILQKKDTAAITDLVKKQTPATLMPFSLKLTQLMDLQERVGKQLYENSRYTYIAASKNFVLWILFSLLIAASLSFLIIKNIRRLIKEILESNDSIRLSENKYRSILENASDAIYLADNTGNFIDLSNNMCKMLGYSKDELMQINFADIIDPETLKTNPIERPANPNQPIFKERTFMTREGEKIEVEISGQRISGNTLMGVARDITGRKRMEAELREAELKFRTVAEKSMLGVYITQNKRFLYVNPRFAEIFGYTRQELMALSTGIIDAIYAEEDRAMIREKIRARDNGETEGAHYEAVGLKKDGTRTYVEFYGNRVTINGQPATIGTTLEITERKKTENELKISEQKYKLLFESNPMPLWIVAKDDMTVMAANAAAAKLYGYKPQELLQMDIKKLRAVKYWDALSERYQTDIHEATDFGVVEHIKKDGTEILVNVIAQDIIFEGRFARLLSTNDVTEKLKAEDELRLSEQKYKMLFENNPSPLTMIAKDDLSFIAINEEAANLYGYDKDELLRMSIKELIPAEDLQMLQERFAMDVTGSTDFGIIRQVRRDQSIINVRIIAHDFIFEGRPVRLSMIIDVTERLKAEESLRQSEARFRGAFENASIGVALVSLQGEWLQVNRTLCKMLGYNEDELLKLTFQQITHPDDLESDLEFLGQTMAGETDNYRVEKQYIHHDGNIVWANLNVSLIRDQNKQPLYYLSIIENITEKLESQLKFQNLVEDSIVGVYILQNGKLVYVNPRIKAETGYSEEEIIGMPYEGFIYRDDREFVMKIIDSREKGLVETVRYEARVIKKDGDPLWYEIIGSTTVYQGATALIGTMVDITERKSAEMEIQRLTRLYQFISSINESMLKAEDADQVYADACRIAVEIGGFQMAWIGTYDEKKDRVVPVAWSGHEDGFFAKMNVAGMNVSQSAIPSARAIRERSHFYYNDIANDPDIPLDIRHEMIKRRYLSGVSFPIVVNGEIVAAMVLLMSESFFFNEEEIGLLRDVTGNITYALAKIKIQALQNQSEANLRSIFDSTDVSYLLLDKEYNIISLNQQMRDIYQDNVGITLREGDNLIESIVLERRDSARKIYDSVVRTKKPSGYEASFTNNGFTRHFAASVFPIIVGDKAIGLCISTIDITERRNALEKLSSANDDLQKKTKELEYSNTELEQFAYVASHDLQEPLRMVTSFLSQLEKKYSDILDEKGKKYIYFATDGAKRMRQLILDLLEFSRVGRTEDSLEDVDFNNLINEVLPLYRKNIEELNAKVHVEQLPTLQVYKTPVRQVFQNLVGNSLKYHKDGVAPVIGISSKETKTAFEFSVKDNGIGIDPEYFNQIFIIFKRLHNRDQYPGTGMGLAITKKIVENMGGRIWVDSREGEGSVFHFTIPKHTNR